jgi:hypothetical protein
MIGRRELVVIGEMLFQHVGPNLTEFLLEQPKIRDRAYGPGWLKNPVYHWLRG